MYRNVVGYHPGIGYVAGGDYVVGAGYPRVIGAGPAPAMHMMVHPAAAPEIHSAPWRPMMAPGNPPLGEGHVPMPLSPETFNGQWTATGGTGAPPGTLITFSARPQKPFKLTRILARTTVVSNTNGTAIGTPIAQLFVGTDLQQGELGFIDLATIGAGGSFDTWLSAKQAEPGVLIRCQTGLTVYPSDTTTHTDTVLVTVNVLGHFLH
jgi:hypothetical protein